MRYRQGLYLGELQVSEKWFFSEKELLNAKNAGGK